jgi:hypothetical protein
MVGISRLPYDFVSAGLRTVSQKAMEMKVKIDDGLATCTHGIREARVTSDEQTTCDVAGTLCHINSPMANVPLILHLLQVIQYLVRQRLKLED